MLNTIDRIKKSLIQIQKRCSFWAYLSLFLKFKEIEAGKMEYDTAGISPDGEVFYVKEFIKSLDDEELIGLIVHEVCHLVFLTELRQGSMDRTGWNFASDLSINSILKLNNFKLPKGGIIPDNQDSFKIGAKTVKDISKKTAEEIYDELPKIKRKGVTYILGDGSGKELGISFDEHLKGKDGKILSPKEKKALEKDWLDKMAEAINVSRMKGDVPKGMERLLGRLHEEKINWRTLLMRFVQNSIPYDFSWTRFSKKSMATGIPFPSTIKEQIEIVCAIDTSGSINDKDLSDFLSEIFAICRAYQQQLKMTLITCDAEIQDTYEIINGSIDTIKNEVKIKGGGGTSFLPVVKWIEENKRDAKLLLYLTDGFGDKIEKQPYDILWVLSKDGSDDLLKDVGQVIKLYE